MLPQHGIAPLPSATPKYSLSAFNLNSGGCPSVGQGKLARCAEERFAIVEEAIQRVYDFARISVHQLSAICGQEADYYLRLIFQRGAALYPTPKQDPPPSCHFTRCESSV